MTSRPSGTSSREDVQKFLDSLDDYTPPPPSATTLRSPSSTVSSPSRTSGQTTRPIGARVPVTRQAAASTTGSNAAGGPLAATRPAVAVKAQAPNTSAATTNASTTVPASNPINAPSISGEHNAGGHSAVPSSTSAPSQPPAPAAAVEDAQSMLDFLDEITQRSATPTQHITPTSSITSPLNKKPSIPSGLTKSGSRGNVAGHSSTTTNISGPASSSIAAGRRSTDSTRSTSSITRAGAATTAAGSSGSSAAVPVTVAASSSSPPAAAPAPVAAPSTGGGWGWGSVWSSASNLAATASNVVQQARTVAEEQVKTHAGALVAGEGLIKKLGDNEQAKKWSQGVVDMARGAHLDQIGKDLKSTTIKSLTDLLNAVAPPIAEHEVIEVTLSHSMVGYDGIETLVYRGLSKIMDQIEGGTLIVNPRRSDGGVNEDDEERNLNVVHGLSEAWKRAESDLSTLVDTTFKPSDQATGHERSDSTAANDLTVPVTRCPIYLHIQPVIAPLPYLPLPSSAATAANSDAASSTATPSRETHHLFFVMVLRDPTHALEHHSLSQSMPQSWLAIPFEDNEWVEDVMVDIIRRSVESLGQEYISHRMRAQSVALDEAREDAQKALDAANSQGQGQTQEQGSEVKSAQSTTGAALV